MLDRNSLSGLAADRWRLALLADDAFNSNASITRLNEARAKIMSSQHRKANVALAAHCRELQVTPQHRDFFRRYISLLPSSTRMNIDRHWSVNALSETEVIRGLALGRARRGRRLDRADRLNRLIEPSKHLAAVN